MNKLIDQDKPIPFDGEQLTIEALDPEIWVQKPKIPDRAPIRTQFEVLIINKG